MIFTQFRPHGRLSQLRYSILWVFHSIWSLVFDKKYKTQDHKVLKNIINDLKLSFEYQKYQFASSQCIIIECTKIATKIFNFAAKIIHKQYKKIKLFAAVAALKVITKKANFSF